MTTDNRNNQTAKTESQNLSEQEGLEFRRGVTDEVIAGLKQEGHEVTSEDISELREAETYWPHDKAGDELFRLEIKLAVLAGYRGYDFPGPIPPEVAKWVLANLPEEMLKP
jgi:hypothetical protein